MADGAVRSVLASVPLAAWCALCVWSWPAPASRTVDAAWLAAAIAGGAVAFYAATIALRMPERVALIGALSSRRRR
jgi:hypothetical protein